MGDPTKAVRCVGIWGRLFGHTFVKRTAYRTYDWHYCFRCGMEAGTTTSTQKGGTK